MLSLFKFLPNDIIFKACFNVCYYYFSYARNRLCIVYIISFSQYTYKLRIIIYQSYPKSGKIDAYEKNKQT